MYQYLGLGVYCFPLFESIFYCCFVLFLEIGTMANSSDPPQNVTPYSLHQTQQEGTGFRSKADDIFGSLGGLEQKYQDGLTQRKEDKKRSHDDDEEDEEESRGQFKKPSLPSSRERGSDSRDRRYDSSSRDRSSREDRNRDRDKDFVDRNRDHYRGGYDPRHRGRGNFSKPPRGRFHQPDYKLNPDKWKKYSLEDTSLHGDSSNRSVALDFINELRKRKADEKTAERSEDRSDSCSKIEFHKPASVSSSDTDEEGGKRKNYGGVYRMSEYVVGMAKKPKSRHHAKVSSAADEKSSGSSTNLSLGHLAEDDDLDTDESMDMTTSKETDQSGDRNESVGTQSVEKEEKPADSEEREEPEKEKTQFKFGKGKGKRKIRARQADDDDED